MKQLRVILADDEPITLLDIKEILIEEGYKVIGECEDGVSAVNLAKILKPDLVILDIKMPVMNGIDAAKILSQERIAPVLLLTAYSSNEFIEQAGAAGVLAYLIKPVTKNCLIAASKIALKRAQEFNVLRDENLSLQDALETRKLIERAKGILEKEYLLSEENAFKKIRQISMKQNKSMKDVAKAIILSLS
ncbi:ANTAR domain-containing response regulator [Desulfosporosinus nitroreducens]|uniref:Stage 0 sporulation protein A homolog n=1 Tax=Desulfosporosinus nitroreducens TaxID=2018668 RepID=A0ABT8QWD1_9FIRM|nr:response regulator [Desulfosporosinus nitroreducens]MDO0825639.1 response regulator [Desulfosporosinus nitroreducens]